jgi:hypothetical protein
MLECRATILILSLFASHFHEGWTAEIAVKER